MRLSFDEEAEAFRADLDDWLDRNAPSLSERAEPKRSSAHLPEWARAWQRRLFDAGWLVPGWPPKLGGRNATPVQTMVYFEELSHRELPRALNPQGLGIVAPSLHEHGSERQQQQWLLPTLRGEVTWCIGMSEPGAGSDLASLRTRAQLQPDGWHVTGQKVWTSGAHDADWCLCFVRTEPDAPKHRGLSVLVVDMASPGVTCRPLPAYTDAHRADFNEVFFDDVVVPEADLVGERGQGWPISMGSLGHERGMLWIAQQSSLERDVEALIKLARERSDLGSDGAFADRVVDLWVDAQTMKVMGYRGFAKFAQGRAAPEHSILKLFSSEAGRRLSRITTEALGAEAFDRAAIAPLQAVDESSWFEAYLWAFAQTIAGGTSEIQRNIIAERILGLPRR
jgi:alkylation response protein AidB-like acyl-CoA dehydrogenase